MPTEHPRNLSSLRAAAFTTMLALALLLTNCTTTAAQGVCSWSDVGVSQAITPLRIDAMVAGDAGAGSALHAAGQFSVMGTSTAGVGRWDGTGWTMLGAPMVVEDLIIFDDGRGPALHALTPTPVPGSPPTQPPPSVQRWDGTAWSPISAPMTGFGSGGCLATYDDGTEPALYVYMRIFFGLPGAWVGGQVARWDGVNWTMLSGNPGRVLDMVAHDDGTGLTLYTVGMRLSRWNGASWDTLQTFHSASVTPDASGTSLAAYDFGLGPDLYVGTQAVTDIFTGLIPGGVSRWDGSVLTPLPPTPGPMDVRCMSVFDEGVGPQLHVNGTTAWDGFAWTTRSAGPGYEADTSVVMDDGAGPALFVGGAPMAGAQLAVSKWDCSSYISLGVAQLAAGGPVFLSNTNLTPGREYFNLFSTTPCPTGPGTGSGLYGICLTSASLQSLAVQLQTPLGAGPLHFVANQSHVLHAPLVGLPPLTVDAICLDVTGGVIGFNSPVVRVVIR